MSNKSVLILDTPETCVDCQFCCEFHEGTKACCSITDDDKDKSLMKEIDCENGYCQGKPDWCPLRKLPETKPVWQSCFGEDFENGYGFGWNACLREIMRGQNNG